MRDKSQRTVAKKTCFVVTKHHIIGTADMNGKWDFQFQQANEKENYKQIDTYFMFYIFTIHSTITNKQKKKLLFTFSLLFFTLESKVINAKQ